MSLANDLTVSSLLHQNVGALPKRALDYLASQLHNTIEVGTLLLACYRVGKTLDDPGRANEELANQGEHGDVVSKEVSLVTWRILNLFEKHFLRIQLNFLLKLLEQLVAEAEGVPIEVVRNVADDLVDLVGDLPDLHLEMLVSKHHLVQLGSRCLLTCREQILGLLKCDLVLIYFDGRDMSQDFHQEWLLGGAASPGVIGLEENFLEAFTSGLSLDCLHLLDAT